jgi:hypothetical protein
LTAEPLKVYARAVAKAFSDIATITAPPARITFDGGDYERLYVKPGFSLGSSLLTSRELLVLVTVFFDVQARTIKMVEKALEGEKGRLEAGMAIVFHRDPSGDDKLRDWGRERGVTILPIFAPDEVPSGNDLHNALCAGLYSQDPFDLSSQLFGRTDIPDMARRLTAGNIQAMFGIRKIGKTSVLNRILEEARDFHGMACVMADCSDDSLSALDAGMLLERHRWRST